MKNVKILLNKNSHIIAYCDFGELENSIEIEVEDDFEFENDIQNYIYEDKKLIYRVDLDKLKAQKIQEFKTLRDKKISEDLEVDGALYQVRAEDLQKFFLKKVEHDLMPDSSRREIWRLADNTYKEITFEDIKTILSVYGQRQRDIFYKFGVLEAQVNACQSVEEIEAIKWL